MKNCKRIFLQLIAEGLKENPQVVEEVKALSENDFHEILNFADKHSLLALLYEGLDACYAAGMTNVFSYLKQISEMERCRTLALYQIYFVADQISAALNQKRITVVVLKGPTVGACYKMPELRKSGDLDLWLPELNSFDDALYQSVVDVLCNLGFSWDHEKGSQHHRVFRDASGLKVEIHNSFCDLFPEKERNRAIEKFKNSIQKESLHKIRLLNRYEFLSLSGADFVFYNLLHMAQHYYMKGFGWKFICDWAMMLKYPLPKEEKDRLYQLLVDVRLLNFAEAVSLLAIRFFCLDERNVEFLFNGCISEKTIQTLAEQLFDAGEFGALEENRLYAPGKNSTKDMLVLFHLQMKKNFSRTSKIIILWPILWIFTLGKFIYNNRTLRHVSTFAILKDAKERGQKTEEMGLFEQ